MKKKIYKIADLRENENDIINEVPMNPGIYKWWCDKTTIEEILVKLDISFDECSNDLENKNNFYCMYVGDTLCLKRRIVSNHIRGSIRKSTFRKTIAAVLIGSIDESQINKLLDEFCIEFYEYGENDYHNEQNKQINEKFRPLNNNDISRENEKYSEKRHYKTTKNGRRSRKLTELRNELNNN